MKWTEQRGPDTVNRLDPSGLIATTGDGAEGACVFTACEEKKTYSTSTTYAAADTRMTWYLETQAASSERIDHADYARFSVSGGFIVGMEADAVVDRHGHWYVGVGPQLGLPGVTFSLTQGYIHGPSGIDLHSPEEIGTFVSGWTRTEAMGLVYGYGHTSSSNERYADEFGIFSPTASVGLSYGERVPGPQLRRP